MNNAAFETPLTMVIEIDFRNSIEHEEKYDIRCRRTRRWATGESQKFAMFTAERAPALPFK